MRERVSARVAIDETAAEHGALGAGVADAVCLKIGRCGGISGLLAAASAGARLRCGGIRLLDAGRPAGSGRRPARGRRPGLPWTGAGLRAGDAGMFEGIEDPLPVRAGRIALPSALGWASDRSDRTGIVGTGATESGTSKRLATASAEVGPPIRAP